MSTGRRPRPAKEFGEAGETVAANVRRLRMARGLSIYTLSDALSTAGRPIAPAAIGKIERRERQVTVDDLAVLATALGVQPRHLLDPGLSIQLNVTSTD